MSACKYCSKPIKFDLLNGGWCPMDLDGSRHKCEPKRAPAVSTGILQAGLDYTPSCGECNAPPWEVCACSFQECRAA